MSKKPPFVSTVSSRVSPGQGNASSAEEKSSKGTSIAKYEPTITRQKSTGCTRQHCITTMKNYKGKSLEELRTEDYMANRKGPQPIARDELKSKDTVEGSEILAMCERIKKLEVQQKALAEENAVLKTQIADSMYRSNAQAYGNQMPSAYSWPMSPTEFPPSPVQAASSGSSGTPGEVKKNGASSKKDSHMMIAIPGSPSIAPSKGLNKSFSHTESAPWLQRRSTPRPMVHGQAENANPLPTVQSNRYLFVTRLARTVTNDQISDYMARKLSSKRRPVCISLTRPEEPPNKVASFRVELLPEEFDEAMAPNFWDKGVLVSEFKFPNKSKTARSKSLAKNRKFDASF